MSDVILSVVQRAGKGVNLPAAWSKDSSLLLRTLSPASLSYTAVSLLFLILLVVLNRFKGAMVFKEGEHLTIKTSRCIKTSTKKGGADGGGKKSRVTNLMYPVCIAATVNTPTVRSQIIPS